VNAGVSTEPTRAAQPSGPPRAATRAAASGPERVSFQRIAGRRGRRSEPRTTRPCCWAPTETAASSPARPVAARAAARASAQIPGSVSLAPPEPVTVWGALAVATTWPPSASTTTTLVDWVELSTPATRLTAHRQDGIGGRRGRSSAGSFACASSVA
jgi:hypothetical protein